MDRLKDFSSRLHGDSNSFPGVPDSLRADPFHSPKPTKLRADTAPYITPYLSLRSRLSQIWINRWTVLLLLVLVRVVLLIAQLRENISDARSKALSACSKVEDIGSAMASMPHYMSVGVNDLAATGIEKSVHGMVKILDLVVQGVEGIIIFYINFLVATYTCLLTALVHGSLEVVASVTEDATKAFNSLIDGASGEIEDIASGLKSAIDKLTDSIENSVFGKLIPDIPAINFTKPIEKLKTFNLSTDGFVKDIQKLNDDLPTFEEVKNMTESAISTPFNLLRKALNESYGGYTFDKATFPLAQKQKLTFCSDNNGLNDFFQHLYKLVDKSRVTFIVILTLLAIAAMAPMAWLEIRRWRQQRKHAKLVSQNQFDPMDVAYISSRPSTATFGINLAARFKGKKQILVRWCIAYATSPPALFVLSLALTGLFSCLCQVILLKAVQKEVPALTGKVGAFADNVVSNIEKVSVDWAGDANGVITGFNDDINRDVLGYVTNATGAVNNTLNTFLEKMEDGLEAAFNGTILHDPIKSILHCVIGLKIESVQKGLTWVHDHAHVEFPLFPNNTFSMGAKDSISGDSDLHSFLASPSSVTTDEVTGAVKHVTKWLRGNVVQEAFLSMGILLVYFIVVLIGVVRMLAGMCMPDRGRAGDGLRYVVEDQPSSHPSVVEEPPVQDAAPGPRFPRFKPASTIHGNRILSNEADNEKVMVGANGSTSYDGNNNPYWRDEKSRF